MSFYCVVAVDVGVVLLLVSSMVLYLLKGALSFGDIDSPCR